MSDRARSTRAAGAIAAAYTAFLLCAQFGFLAQLEATAGRGSGILRAVLAAMGAGGIAGSVLGARLGRRSPARAARAGLWAVAIACAATVPAARPAALVAAGGGLGAALGFLTVVLAGSLGVLAPRARWGSVAGAGTGTAYAISNLPPLFTGPPAVRALLPAALCVLAALFAPAPARDPARASEDAEPGGGSGGRGRFAALVGLFALLVAVDSAVFAHLQHTPGLLTATWGGGAHQARQGAVHLAAALVAGAALDRGRLVGVALATVALFAGALPALADPALAGAAAVLYAVGISLYSAGLVVAPALSAGRRGAFARAAILYGLAGWIGSAAGVGAAEAGVVGRWLAAGAPIASAPEPAPAEKIALGREVYLAEGCQHCHSQFVRPRTHDELWWGPARPLDRSDRPPTPGNRRLGPDLANVGLRRSALWQELHLRDPRALAAGSRMPSYAHLFAAGDPRGPALVAYLGTLGEGAAAHRAAAIATWTPGPRAEGDADAGERLFAHHCAACHGAGGRGDGAAARSFARPTMDLTKGRFFRAVPRPGESERTALARAIRFGLEPGTMPGHEWLSARELDDLVAFVERLAQGDAARRGRG